jgi:FkbM family methyltransferase
MTSRPRTYFAGIKNLFKGRDGSSTARILASYNVEVERQAQLYESLALRVVKLEDELSLKQKIAQGTQFGENTQVGQSAQPTFSPGAIGVSRNGWPKITWPRILRHMLPHKVRRLLAEHDAFESMRSELQRLRELLHGIQRGRFRVPDEAIIVHHAPEFPRAILDPAVASKITIIDVGAQDLVSEEHIYAPLQRAGATLVIGFEPLPDNGSAPRRADRSVTMLNHFVGAGGPATFYVTRFDPASSLFKPNTDFLAQFIALPDMCETVSTFDVQTTRLDDVPEIYDCDYLKIDVQGGELDVLKGGQRLLEQVVAIHCEVEFAPVYEGQPLFADVDTFLRAAGFELIDFVNAGYNRYQALPERAIGSRLLWAEAIYFKPPQLLMQQSMVKLLKAAYIAHVNYSMYDLAARFLSEYDKMKTSSKLSRIYSREMSRWMKHAAE